MDKREALRTFMTGENFHLQHYLGAHREELNGEYGYTFRVGTQCSGCSLGRGFHQLG